MSSNDFRQVRSGESLNIPADAWNEFLRWSARARSESFRSGSGPVSHMDDPGAVILYNASGSDVDFGHVLGIDSVDGMILPSGQTGDDPNDRVINLERRILIGDTPTSDHIGRWAIVLEGTPTETGGVPSAMLPNLTTGVGLFSGVWPALVNVIDVNHRYAEVAPASADPTLLASAVNGSAQILRQEPGTGERWAVLRFPFKVFIPSETFAGSCMIEEENPNDKNPNDTAMYNGVGVDEQRLLVKAATPFGVPRQVKEIAFHVESWTQDFNRSSVANSLSMATPGLEFRVITEDFDYEGDDCATWTTKPTTSETGKATCAPLGSFEAYAFIPDVIGKTVKVWGGHGFRWGWGQGASGNTLTCYGIEIRAVDVDGGDVTDISGIRETAPDLGRMIFY